MRIFFTLLNLHTHTTMNQFVPLTKLGFRSSLIPKSVVFNQQLVRSSPRVCALAFQPPTAYKFSTTMASSTKPRSISSPKHQITATKENDIKAREIEIDSVEGDSDGIENMSVVELKQKLRSLGIPAKGRKSELVDALRGSLSYNSDDSPDNKPNRPKKISKRKIEGSCTQIEAKYVNTAVSRISEAKRTKKVVDHAPAEETIKEVKTKLLTKKEETSVRSNKATVSKLHGGKGEVAAQVVSGAAEASKVADPLETQCEPWTVLTHKKPQKGWIPYNPRTMRQPPLTADTKHVKIMSWNVNGLRALLKVEGFSQLAQREDFDVLCLQETKLQDKDVEAIKCSLLEGYEDSFWTCSVTKLGYSGTAIISRIKPLSVRYGLGISDHDSEGRLVTVEYDTFYLLSGYVPNSGDGLRRLSYRVTEWDPSLTNYMKELEKAKPVILTGDLNCAHEEIDIYNPAGNKRSAGFTIEERQSFETNFLNRGFVDTFRNQHPGVIGYTYWGYRHNGRKTNKGWRLDYFLVSESIAKKAYDSYILPDVGGSDHSPIGLILTV